MTDIFTADGHTIGEFVSAVSRIEDKVSARGFVEEYLGWLQKHPHPEGRHTAEEIMRSNIGWCFGEGMTPERITMWNQVCGASHPVFGTKRPGGEEALRMGMEIGRGFKTERKRENG